MKIKLTTLMCGPEGSFPIGTELNLDEKKARELIDGGYALELKPRAVETAAVKPPEKSTAAEQDAAKALANIGVAGGKRVSAPRAAGGKKAA